LSAKDFFGRRPGTMIGNSTDIVDAESVFRSALLSATGVGDATEEDVSYLFRGLRSALALRAVDLALEARAASKVVTVDAFTLTRTGHLREITKRDLLGHLQCSTGLTQSICERAVDALFNEMIARVEVLGRAQVKGIGDVRSRDDGAFELVLDGDIAVRVVEGAHTLEARG
jgi:hypothetical protein